MNALPFTTWNIDEVVADVVATSAKRFAPDNQQEVRNAADWISDDFGYYLDKSVVCSPAELLADAEQARAESIQSFTEDSNLQNWFGPRTRSDCLFFWSAVVLFYQRLVNDGFNVKARKAPATDQPPVATYKTFADLFINPDDIDSCVDALRRYRPEKPCTGGGLDMGRSR